MPQFKRAQILKENLNHIIKAQPIICLLLNCYIALYRLHSYLFRVIFFR